MESPASSASARKNEFWDVRVYGHPQPGPGSPSPAGHPSAPHGPREARGGTGPAAPPAETGRDGTGGAERPPRAAPPPLLNSPHPVPTQSPMPFSQPGPAFSQQGQQPVFPRERPLRPNIQPQGPVGILHFNQPGSANPRPFIPPRQQFLQAPGQPFLTAHAQPNMQVQICSGVGVVKELFQVTQYCVVPMLLYRSNAAKTKLYEVTDMRQIYNIVLCLKK